MHETKEPTVHLAGQDLAEYLDVTAQALSRAVRRDYNAAGYRVSEWANWHHNHKRIEGYDVPRSIAQKIIPQDQWGNHGFVQNRETMRAKNPRSLALVHGPEDRAHHAATLLRSLSEVDELRSLDLETVAERLESFGA